MIIHLHLHLLKYFYEIIIMDKGEIKVYTTINNLFFNSNTNNLHKKYQHLLPTINQI